MSESVDASAENLADTFIEYLNARDLEGIGEIVSADVTSDLFDGAGIDSAVQGLGDLLLRYPRLLATRAEDGNRPLAALWIPDEQQRFRLVGHFDLSTEDELIEHITYVEDSPDGLLVEEPDHEEMGEWLDWGKWDTGEDTGSDRRED